jgi:hypothetical protein
MPTIKPSALTTPQRYESNSTNAPALAGFEPLQQLWEGSQPIYPSEGSARWALRKLRAALIEAQAMGSHRGRLMFHRQRFAKVAEQAALNDYALRSVRHCDA